MIELLAIISFLAIAGYCLMVLWPHLHWSSLTSRQPGGLRRQYTPTEPARGTRKLSPSRPSARSAATSGLYSSRSEAFVRRGTSTRNNQDPAGRD